MARSNTCARLRRRIGAIAIGALAVPIGTGERSALAEDPRPSARLDLERDADAVACPDEAAFRARVATRLGYDPFVADGSMRIRVRFASRGTRVEASVAVEQGGRAGGTRRLEEAKERCPVLADAAAAAVAIAIDPVGRPPPPPPVNEAPATVAAPPPESATTAAPVSAPVSTADARPPASPPGPPVVPHVLLDAALSAGTLPGTGLGAQAGVGLRRGALSFTVEGRVEGTPDPVRLTALDRVTSSMYSAAIVPCGHVRFVNLCLGARVGSLQATALDVSRPSLESSLTAAAFARILAAVPIGGAFTLRLGAEGGLPLVRTTFSVDRQAIWTSPAVQGSLLVGVGWAFP